MHLLYWSLRSRGRDATWAILKQPHSQLSTLINRPQCALLVASDDHRSQVNTLVAIAVQIKVVKAKAHMCLHIIDLWKLCHWQRPPTFDHRRGQFHAHGYGVLGFWRLNVRLCLSVSEHLGPLKGSPSLPCLTRIECQGSQFISTVAVGILPLLVSGVNWFGFNGRHLLAIFVSGRVKSSLAADCGAPWRELPSPLYWIQCYRRHLVTLLALEWSQVKIHGRWSWRLGCPTCA